MKKIYYEHKYLFFYIFITTTLGSRLSSFSRGPKEKALWNKMQSRIPIINPLDLDSPFIQGMGHDMLEEVENKALKDTNMGTTPIFPMRPGYDSNLIFGIVGKPLPNNLIQWAKAQKGRVPYIVKIGQGIANKAQALAYASIPSISIPEKIDDSIKVGDKIDFQIVDSKPSQPITPSGSGSLLSNIKEKATEMAKDEAGKLIDKVKSVFDAGGGNNDDGDQKKQEYSISINKNRK